MEIKPIGRDSRCLTIFSFHWGSVISKMGSDRPFFCAIIIVVLIYPSLLPAFFVSLLVSFHVWVGNPSWLPALYFPSLYTIGRNKKAPGLVFTIYNPGKPRDRSHYEHFETYHSRVYCNVEPTSVTPFSAQLRERALHAIVFGLLRLRGDSDLNADPPKLPSFEEIEEVKDIIAERIEAVDADELEKTLDHIDSIIEKWEIQEPGKYQDFAAGDVLPLMFPAGTMRNAAWGKRGFPTPTSMRNVDASCEATVLENGYFEEDE